MLISIYCHLLNWCTAYIERDSRERGVCEKERERQHEAESRGKKDRKREERKTNR